MKIRRLIINADDCNLTAGVTRGILRCHDQGIVTSTTLLMNLPMNHQTVRELKRRGRLGLGVHLNVTLGEPLSRREKIPTLLQSEGRFRRPLEYGKKRPALREIIREYEAQIERFAKHFDRKPDHVDTHHHLHDDPLFFKAIKAVAEKWELPVRRSRIFLLRDGSLPSGMLRTVPDFRTLKTTDYLFGNLEARYIWQKESFLAVAEVLSEGTGEIGCHPGYCDSELKKLSSMQEVREKEMKVFADRSIRKALSQKGIELIRFSDI